MTLYQKLRLKLLKDKTKRLYLMYLSERDRYDCGNALASTINPRISELANKVNRCLDRLAKLDPTTPTTRMKP